MQIKILFLKVIITSGDSCVLFSSGSEICLRVIKVCSTSVLLFCILCLSTSLSLFKTWTYTHYQYCSNKVKAANLLSRLFLLHRGSLPLCRSALMIDKEGSS